MLDIKLHRSSDKCRSFTNNIQMKPIQQVINDLTMRSHSNQCTIFWVRSSNSANAELDNEFKGLFTMLQLKEGVLDIDFHPESLIPACLSGMLIGGTDPNCVAKQTTGQGER
ncbi:hypothetical protein EV2_027695 [Malus domestica]